MEKFVYLYGQELARCSGADTNDTLTNQAAYSVIYSARAYEGSILILSLYHTKLKQCLYAESYSNHLVNSGICFFYCTLIVALILIMVAPLQKTMFAQAIVTPNDNNRSGLLTFENSTSGIIIQYPSDWIIGLKNSTSPISRMTAVSFLSLNSVLNDTSKSPVFLTIRTIRLPPINNTNIDAYTALNLEHFKNVHIIQSGNASLAGNPAYKVIYSDNNNMKEIQALEIWTVSSGRAYHVDFFAEKTKFNRYLPIVERMINSLEITNPLTTLPIQ